MHTAEERRPQWVKSIPFFAIHAIAIVGVIAGGWSWKGFALALTLYVIRMFGVTGGYHRYFSHRTYRTSRVMQFLLALLATSSAQKGVLWWAAHHRQHHKFSDQPGDVHSLKREGFWWSHVGWILSARYDATEDKWVKDLTRFPELRWLDKWHLVPPTALGVGLFFLGNGWQTLLWGLFVSTVMLWHGTFTINSLTHWWGNRRYVTTDDSRNNFWLAIITLGEGWHNNHHYYQASTRQGFFWWEIDITFYVLKVMSWLGLVWDLQSPSEKVRDNYVRGPESGRAPVAEPRPIGRIAAPQLDAAE